MTQIDANFLVYSKNLNLFLAIIFLISYLSTLLSTQITIANLYNYRIWIYEYILYSLIFLYLLILIKNVLCYWRPATDPPTPNFFLPGLAPVEDAKKPSLIWTVNISVSNNIIFNLDSLILKCTTHVILLSNVTSTCSTKLLSSHLQCVLLVLDTVDEYTFPGFL